MSEAQTRGGTDAERAEFLNATEIVNLLKSDDGKERARALEELYPGESVSMVRVQHGGQIMMANARTSNATSLFAALTWAAAQIGNQLGLHLQWGPQAVPADKIVVAGPGGIPMMK